MTAQLPAIVDGMGDWVVVFERAVEPGMVVDPSDVSVRIDKATGEVTMPLSL